ncbi:MAG TPA: hypothetical protein VLE44_00280 [Candidatus Saccharimonadales bacterium]|nr:hypothetical protein [Candidatus Saccharimonadales bacterium]
MPAKAEISRRHFLEMCAGIFVGSHIGYEPSPEKIYFYTHFRKGAPQIVHSFPHFESSSVDVGENVRTDYVPFTEKVSGDWLKWTNRPLKIKQGIGITTDEWIHVELPDTSYGFVWSGFTYAIDHSKPMPDAKKYQVLNCLGKIHGAKAYNNDGSGESVVNDQVLKEFSLLSGYDIWLGYPDDGESADWNVQDGFAWPHDIKRTFYLKADNEKKEKVEVWGYQSQTDPTYVFILPFKNTKEFARNDGKYMGPHPCGGFAVAASEVQRLIPEN